MKALRTLQEVIEHPVLGTSAETVCATLLMSYYEMMVSEKRGSQHVAHAGAATKLIILRGPKRIRTNFEKELLRAQRGHMIMQAFLQHSDCVLLGNGWRDIRLEKSRHLDALLVDRLLRIFCGLPTLARLARGALRSPARGAVEEILQYAEAFNKELVSLEAEARYHAEDGETAYEVVLSKDDNEMFPSANQFPSVDRAIFWTWFWAANIILDASMASISTDQQQHFEISADASARKICMSYDFAAGLKPLGAQFIQVPLICAYFVSNEEVKAWILEKINVLVVELHVFYTREYLETMSAAIFGLVEVASGMSSGCTLKAGSLQSPRE